MATKRLVNKLTLFFTPLQTRLILFFLAVSILPLILVGWLTFDQSRESLLEQNKEQLITVRDLKAGQLEAFFNLVREDIVLYSKMPMVTTALNRFSDVDNFYDVRSAGYLANPNLDDSGNNTAYDQAHALYHPIFREIVESRDYEDLYLVNHDGMVVYNFDKGNDFGTNLATGDYSTTHLAGLYNALLTASTTEVKFTDFEPYNPSGSIPTSFLGTPVIDLKTQKPLGFLIVQLPLARINDLMQSKVETIGETGQVYLVGEDKLMRTSPIINAEDIIMKQVVDNQAVQDALAGQSNVDQVINYNGVPVLSAYQPLTFGDKTWALLAEFAEEEVFRLDNHLRQVVLRITGISAFVVAVLGFFIARSIAQPLANLAETATNIANGDLELNATIDRKDEIGMLAEAFNKMTAQLRQSISDLQERAKELEQKNLQLEEVDKLKDEFLANTSHELRTPLNGIIGLAESLIDGVTGNLLPQTKTNLGMIVSSGKRLANLVNDILDFSKLKQQSLTLQNKPIYISTLTGLVLSLSKPLLGSKPLALINNVDTDLPRVKADENRVQQIMYNLVGNAIKFTESGEVTVSAKVIATEPVIKHEQAAKTQHKDQQTADMGVKQYLAITVSDTGIGIPADKQEKIFKSFEQADGSTAREYGGTGLGLAVTKQLVELHGGQIWVESQVGHGTQFTFTLPLADDSEPHEHLAVDPLLPNKTAPAVNGNGNGHLPHKLETVHSEVVQTANIAPPDQFHILTVDDDPINLQVLGNHLALKNYTVSKAQSGSEALTFLETGKRFDLIILDIMMPRMSGYEVCHKLRERYSLDQLPIVMLTAKNRISDLVTGFQAGANDYLTKPINKDELLARVHTLLTLKQTQEQLYKSEKKYRTIFEESKDVIFITDVGSNILDVSPACEKLLGYTRHEVRANNDPDLYVNPTDRVRFIELITTTGSVRDFETTLKHKAGHEVTALVTATLWKQDNGTVLGFQGIVRDITHQKSAEQERLKLTAIQSELAVAHNIQQNLLPVSNPDWPDLELVCYSQSAREVGGDFYQYYRFESSEGPAETESDADAVSKYAVAVGDVSGKGISAALLMATSLAHVDASLALTLTPVERMSYLDQAILPYTKPLRQNCALCYLEITQSIDQSQVQIVNAGCMPPYIIRADGSLEHPEIGGFALGQGLGAMMGYQAMTLAVSPGDLIILSSDGLVEAHNPQGDMLGFERLADIIRSGPTTTATAMLTYIKTSVLAFMGEAELHDDLTIVVVQINPIRGKFQ